MNTGSSAGGSGNYFNVLIYVYRRSRVGSLVHELNVPICYPLLGTPQGTTATPVPGDSAGIPERTPDGAHPGLPENGFLLPRGSVGQGYAELILPVRAPRTALLGHVWNHG